MSRLVDALKYFEGMKLSEVKELKSPGAVDNLVLVFEAPDGTHPSINLPGEPQVLIVKVPQHEIAPGPWPTPLCNG